MKLSYIIPIYNVEQYLRQCIDSILAQTMDDYEIILIDDGSPDSCPAICDEYKEKYPDIFTVIHKENGGLASARNAGIKIAQGEYIFFIDSDDYLMADGVSKLYEKAKEVDADILQTSFFCLNDFNGKIDKTMSPFKYDTVYTHSDMDKEVCQSNKKRMITYVWRNLYRNEFLKQNDIRFVKELKMVEDGPFNTLAFLKAEKFAATDIPVYCYRLRDDSLQRKKYVRDYDLILNRHYQIKTEYYKKYGFGNKDFYSDISEHSIRNLFPFLLINLYGNKEDNHYKILKRIGNSEMMRLSFRDYDIKNFKSKSLDWWMTWCMKYKLYPLAHLLCEKVLYKK